MEWKEICISELEAGKLFEDSGHRTRFQELLECYSEYPFFSRGLCKCMYLSAWDEEHFTIMLETLNIMALGRENDTDDMKLQGDVMAEEMADEHAYGDAYVFRLSGMFLEGKKGKPDGEERLSPEYQYIVRRALEAAEIIDRACGEAEIK